mgnify:CR=1 FL=1
MLVFMCGLVIGFALHRLWCVLKDRCECKEDLKFKEIKNKLKKIKRGRK